MRLFKAQIEPRWRLPHSFLLMINHNANISIQERAENYNTSRKNGRKPARDWVLHDRSI